MSGESTMAEQLAECEAFFSSELFERVQLSRLFSDSKTFADAVPNTNYPDVLASYERARPQSAEALKTFVFEHFKLSPAPTLEVDDNSQNLLDYIQDLWPKLIRNADGEEQGSLLRLSNPYVVPGGRFREIYYWDSYFSALGLVQTEQQALVANMLDNFLDLQGALGVIPNGNRAYYHSRSQPPVLALMVSLLLGEDFERAQSFSADFVARCIAGMETEYRFWMRGQEQVSSDKPAYRRVVRMPNGSVLNRYWDDCDSPRPESFAEDTELASTLPPSQRRSFYRHIRAAAESGWDFSSRWLTVTNQLSSIRTTDLVAVDLNALLYQLETQLARFFARTGQQNESQRYSAAAKQRQNGMQTYLWCPRERLYLDWDINTKAVTDLPSLATAVPLFVGMVSDQQAAHIAQWMEAKLLVKGGLLTTERTSGQQWDAPNGWAPLQCFAVMGLRRYGFASLAKTIIQRWLSTVEAYYQRHGAVMEKYDLIDTHSQACGGEYEVQHGFGWTNGVTQLFYHLLQHED